MMRANVLTKVLSAVVLVAIFTLPMHAGKPTARAVAALSNPRDLSAHDQALADVNSAAVEWSAAVADSDAKLAALQSAQADFDSAVATEAAERGEYEAAQAAYDAAYQAVPKEDSLTP